MLTITPEKVIIAVAMIAAVALQIRCARVLRRNWWQRGNQLLQLRRLTLACWVSLTAVAAVVLLAPIDMLAVSASSGALLALALWLCEVAQRTRWTMHDQDFVDSAFGLRPSSDEFAAEMDARRAHRDDQHAPAIKRSRLTARAA